jgi:protoheme IX farnesyltransferase
LLAIGALTLRAFACRRTFPKLFAAAGLVWALVLLQVSLGIFTVWTVKHPWITSLHVVNGACVLGAAVFFCLRAWQSREPLRPQEEAASPPAPRRPKPLPADRSTLGVYTELAKPRIVYMVLVTTTLGYALGRGGLLPLAPLLHAILGTALSAAGASALNQVIERDRDALMHRTRNRPLPLGQISPVAAAAFGLGCVLAGYAYLLLFVNITAALCAFVSAALYVGVYTPLKQFSWLNTSVGAVPGAMPPLIGWAAATGQLNLGAWVLFAILFLWQHPHFFSIAWMYREDYERGGLKMLPVVKPDGVSTFRQSLTFAVLLVPVSLLPTFVRLVSWHYFFGALLCGIWFLLVCVRWRMSRSNQDARKVLRASIIYLPLLLLLIFVDTLLT